MTEVIIGLDPHKASNTIAMLDRDETILTRRRFDNTDEGMVDMVDAVGELAERVWAVEGANGIGRSVAQRLVALGEVVVDVPAKLATLRVPKTHPHPLTSTFAYLQLVLKAAPSGPKSVLKVSSDG